MDTLNLPLILENYNKQLFDSLKNELMQSFKKDMIEDIKMEIYKLFINNEKKDNTNICGFKRTRQRGYCKRHVKGFICPYHLKQLKNSSTISILPDKKPDENLSDTQDLNTEYMELNILNNIEVDQTNNCINKNIIYLEKKINKESLIPISGGPIGDKNIGDPISGSKNKKKKKNKKNKKKSKSAEIEKPIVEKINKDIKVTFIKDTKGKTYARNPFPDNFIIKDKYNCKCYSFVNDNGIDKIKLYLVNPQNKKESKIDIINTHEFEDLMLTIYTKETVDIYFNK
jgi:hypothetical protein